MSKKDKYQRKSHHDFVLDRPNVYLGEITVNEHNDIFWNAKEEKLEQKTTKYSKALRHLFLEVIGNAADNVNVTRELKEDPGKIEITMDEENVTVKNYGRPVEVRPVLDDNGKETEKYVPEMCFGELLTSSNYDDNIKTENIGTNGVGVKAVNIYSKKFKVICKDSIRKKD